MASCETVTIVNKDSQDGKSVINKSDLTKNDVIYKEQEIKPVKKSSKKAK